MDHTAPVSVARGPTDTYKYIPHATALFVHSPLDACRLPGYTFLPNVTGRHRFLPNCPFLPLTVGAESIRKIVKLMHLANMMGWKEVGRALGDKAREVFWKYLESPAKSGDRKT